MMLSAVLLASLLAFKAEDAALAYRSARELVRDCTPRDAGTNRGAIAANRILDIASATGADVRRDIFFADSCGVRRRFVNVYSQFEYVPGAPWIVLLSHYDTKPEFDCPGANDGASTTGLLVALAGRLVATPGLKRNVLLVWTDGEECRCAYGPDDGLIGSRRAVSWIREKGYRIAGVFCLDMLGDRDLRISVPANGSDTLAQIVEHAARRIGHPELVERVPDHVKDDHVPFLEAGFRAVDLIDLSYGPDNSFWHTEKDTMKNVSKVSLYHSGRLVAEIVDILAGKDFK